MRFIILCVVLVSCGTQIDTEYKCTIEGNNCSDKVQDGKDGVDGQRGTAGRNGRDGQDGADGLDAPAANVTLVARKSYSPSIWYNAEWEGRETVFRVPDVLYVITGNAGNHQAILHIGDNECIYKGGADVSKPLKPYNQTQVNKGEIYYLDSGCSLGAEIPADYLSLTVANGDSTTTTTVTAFLTVIGE